MNTNSFIRPSLIASFLSGVFLPLVSIAPVQATTPGKSQLVAQYPGEISRRYNNEQVFTSPSLYSQNYSNNRVYRVFIDNPDRDSGLLNQIRRFFVSDAFRTSDSGRSVIQVGSFREYPQAEAMVRDLQSRGLNGVYISNNSRREMFQGDGANYPPGDVSGYNPVPANPVSRDKTKYYYVIIPGKAKKLAPIENEIMRNAGTYLQYNQVIRRNSPRGPHVAVGPFSKRSEAERFNIYFRSLGLKNARVYYGK